MLSHIKIPLIFDDLDLFSELKVLREVIQTEENKNTPVDILNYIKKLESFPNACIAYRILLTIHVTVTELLHELLPSIVASFILFFFRKK